MQELADELIDAMGHEQRLDRVVRPLDDLADRLLADDRRRRWLRGDWLGHPLHPMLTDLPIGFWTSAFVLDLGGRRMARASTLMVAAGVATAVPTAAAGLADWRERGEADRRVGVVHAVANGAATLLYARSLWHRLRGRHLRGVLLGMAGATAATVGGYLGGHLVFEPASEPGTLPDGARSEAPSSGDAADAQALSIKPGGPRWSDRHPEDAIGSDSRRLGRGY